VVRQRLSCRSYDPTQPVADALIKHCLEAARLAPSACNRQPWRFIVVRDPATRREICRHGLLPGIRHDWLLDAPLIVALCAQVELITHRLAPVVSGVDYYLLDLGIAGEHFVLAATELGLGTCWIGWFREREVRRLLHLPRGVKIASLMAVGFPAKPGPATRPRKALAEVAFLDQWQNPWPETGE